jgi:hypothetical protein
VEVGGGPGTVKIHSIKFFTGGSQATPRRCLGLELQSAVKIVDGAFRLDVPGCVYAIKPLGQALLEITMPALETHTPCRAVEIELGFDDDMEKLGIRLTAGETIAQIGVQQRGQSENACLHERLSDLQKKLTASEQIESQDKLEIAALRDQLDALQVSQNALRSLNVFFEQKAREAQEKMKFLKMNPANQLLLELRRIWRRAFSKRTPQG